MPLAFGVILLTLAGMHSLLISTMRAHMRKRQNHSVRDSSNNGNILVAGEDAPAYAGVVGAVVAAGETRADAEVAAGKNAVTCEQETKVVATVVDVPQPQHNSVAGSDSEIEMQQLALPQATVHASAGEADTCSAQETTTAASAPSSDAPPPPPSPAQLPSPVSLGYFHPAE